ncbi:MAG: CAP domain-containing protein [Legionellaceae bacterium]
MRKIVGFILGLLMASLSWADAVAVVETHDSMAQEIVSHLNRFRATHGLPPLVLNPVISQEARVHSQEMARHVVPFGHDGFPRRLSHLVHTIPNANGGAENVAYNYKTAKIVAEGWINSPGHRKNILGRYNLTGIGIVRDSAGKLYYTQLFLRTENPPMQHARLHGHRSRSIFVTAG